MAIKTQIGNTTEEDILKIETALRRLKLLCIVWGIKAAGLMVASVVLVWFYVSKIMDAEEIPVALHFLTPLIFVLTFIFITAVIGTLKRNAWGVYSGFIVSVIFLFGFPIWTFLGVVGIMSYKRAMVIFGDSGDENFEKMRRAAILNKHKAITKPSNGASR